MAGKFGTWKLTRDVTLSLANHDPMEFKAGDHDAASGDEAEVLANAEGISFQPLGAAESEPVAVFVSGPDESEDTPADTGDGKEGSGQGSETPPPDPATAGEQQPPATAGQDGGQAPAAPEVKYFTHPTGPVTDTAWPVADAETDTTPAQQLYTWAGTGDAPTSADWPAWQGAVRKIPGAAS